MARRWILRPIAETTDMRLGSRLLNLRGAHQQRSTLPEAAPYLKAQVCRYQS